jgi:hypothetical protein
VFKLPTVTLVAFLSAMIFFTTARISGPEAACAALNPECTFTLLDTPGNRVVESGLRRILMSVKVASLYARTWGLELIGRKVTELTVAMGLYLRD